MADTSDRYLLVMFVVTGDGVTPHPMDSIVKRVDLDDAGIPTSAAMDRLAKSIADEVGRKAAIQDRARAALL